MKIVPINLLVKIVYIKISILAIIRYLVNNLNKKFRQQIHMSNFSKKIIKYLHMYLFFYKIMKIKLLFM